MCIKEVIANCCRCFLYLLNDVIDEGEFQANFKTEAYNNLIACQNEYFLFPGIDIYLFGSKKNPAGGGMVDSFR